MPEQKSIVPAIKPFTREDIIHILPKAIKHFGLDKSKVSITSSAALVYKEFLKEAGDVDLVVDDKYFKELEQRFPEQVITVNLKLLNDQQGWDHINAKKILLNYEDRWIEILQPIIKGQKVLDPFHVALPKIQTLGSVLYMKVRLGRVKDLGHIAEVLKDMRDEKICYPFRQMADVEKQVDSSAVEQVASRPA